MSPSQTLYGQRFARYQSINQSINVLGNLPRSGSYGFMDSIYKHIKHVNTYGSKGSKTCTIS